MAAESRQARRTAMTPGVNALRFRCPVSGREIESDFSADAHTLSMIRLFSVSLHCSACGCRHEFKMREALAIDPDRETAERPRPQAAAR
jgi:transcription elongation factor Elf1